MDKAVLIKELKEIFSTINPNGKRYSKVWVTEENYGGLYYSDKINIYAIANKEILEYSPEIFYLNRVLAEKLGKEKLSFIDTVVVYLATERAPIERDDIIIYNANEQAYNTAA